MPRLITFPGQGTPVLGHVFNSYLAQRSPAILAGDHARLVAKQIEQTPGEPASIVACSFLLYKIHCSENRGNNASRVFLGHSLGELSCLAAGNSLFTLQQAMAIAHYRNSLMLQAVAQQQGAREYSMWAISAPKAKSLANDVRRLIKLQPKGSSVALANINTDQQCVVSGTAEDFEHWQVRLRGIVGRCKISRLKNPYRLPFHNPQVLAPIGEPLLSYMWENLKDQGLQTLKTLDHPMICNLTGGQVTDVHDALERFAYGSCNVVEFVKCCETVNSLDITEALHIGPSNVIGKLVAKNCQIRKSEVWNEYMGADPQATIPPLE
ncbi:LADA_0C07646g1_1 [Lachancea dasiensis]|uniref:[acyl-carrier-protein] S-malonyltransferase n=1 Tax=Lachancea dasiensis TaxID=1072105 RepID=A0A1G4IZT2_9SACH|nr:LADA_0C07646g1_1 [Lachancea dasiensis]